MKFKLGIILIILIGFLAYGSHTFAEPFNSPPELLHKLEKMFKWTEIKMNVKSSKRPSIFISSKKFFLPICKKYNKSDTSGCKRIVGLYILDKNIIYIFNNRTEARIDETIIHEMTHALQIIRYGYKFIIDERNKEFLETEADLMGQMYLVEKYKFVLSE